MAASLVAHAVASGVGGATTSGINTTGATALVVAISSNTSPGTISDNKSNTWQLISNGGTNPTLSVYISKTLNIGSGHTFTTGGNFSVIAVQAWSGVFFNIINSSTNSSGSIATTGITAPGALGDTSALFITAFANDGTATASINSSFTISDFQQGVGGTNFGGGLAYKVSSGTEAPTWTRASGTGVNATMLVCYGILGGGSTGGGVYGSA